MKIKRENACERVRTVPATRNSYFWPQWNIISPGSDLGVSLGSPQLLATTITASVSLNF